MTATSQRRAGLDASASNAALVALATGAWRAARWLLGIAWPIALLIAGWQVLVIAGNYSSIILPRPAAVFADMVANPGVYLVDTAITLRVACAGLVIGLFCGALVAVLSWLSRLIAGLVTPVAIAMYAVPTLAFIPVIAQVLGYTESTIAAIAAIISFFPGFVYISSGLHHLPPGSESLFSALGARRWVMLTRLALPSTVPNLLLALRVSASTAVIAAVVAQYLMGTDGLGHAFVYYYKRFEMDRAFGIAIVVMVLSFVMYSLASAIEKWGRQRWT